MLRQPDTSPPIPKARSRSPLAPVLRFFRSPKGYLLLVFVVVIAVALLVEGVAKSFGTLEVATATAVAVDLILTYLYAGRVELPSGALLTGLIVGLILSPTEPTVVVAATSTLAIASKYLFRTRWSNVFNPAAFGLVIAGAVFGSAESWWGASPDLPVVSVVVLLATGFFLADRINKIPMVLAFVGAFYILFSASAILGDPSRVAEVFRSPDANAVLFFAFFMLDDPPTSPNSVRRPGPLCGRRRRHELRGLHRTRRRLLPASRVTGGQPLGEPSPPRRPAPSCSVRRGRAAR